MKAEFPTWQDCLDEFAAGLREHKAKKVALAKRRALVRPHLGLLNTYGLSRNYPAVIGETRLPTFPTSVAGI